MLWIIILAFIVVVAVIATVLIKRNKMGGKSLADSSKYERNKIYVGNLNYRVREIDLKRMFSSYGEVAHVRVVRHIKTNKSQGFAFVSFSSANEATQALRAHGKTLQGRTLVVRLAKER